MKAVARTDAYSEVQRLERARRVLAWVVLRHGDVYAPLLERLDREVEEVNRRISVRDRAERILSSLPLDLKHALAG